MSGAEKMANESVTNFVDQYRDFTSNGASESPAWMKSLREQGKSRFEEIGFPTQRQEEWRFTNVKPILDASYSLVKPGSVASADLSSLLLLGEDARRLVFVDGRFAAELSNPGELPEGAYAGGIAAAPDSLNEVLENNLGRHARVDDHAFGSLANAFTMDGAFVYVPRNTKIAEPIEVVFVSTGSAGAVSYPRILIVSEEGSEAAVVESYVALKDARYLTNTINEYVVGKNAELKCFRVQRESKEAHHVAVSHSVQDRDSRFSYNVLAFGGALSRQDLRMVLDGEGAEGAIHGLYLMGGSQHIDHHTAIEHVRPHCNSIEYLNGILDDRSHAVFTGRIHVHQAAQKTDSKQTNNNLLLTSDARADSQPQLEIYADDVRCTHGATLGPLEDKSVFYLQSRGMSEDDARRMLTYGFGAEILAMIPMDDMRARLDELVRERLDVHSWSE